MAAFLHWEARNTITVLNVPLPEDMDASIRAELMAAAGRPPDRIIKSRFIICPVACWIGKAPDIYRMWERFPAKGFSDGSGKWVHIENTYGDAWAHDYTKEEFAVWSESHA